jgi:hypothetical protein
VVDPNPPPKEYMPTVTNHRLATALAILSDVCRGVRPQAQELEDLRQYATDSERLLPPDELACALVQRELDEFRANRIRRKGSVVATAA